MDKLYPDITRDRLLDLGILNAVEANALTYDITPLLIEVRDAITAACHKGYFSVTWDLMKSPDRGERGKAILEELSYAFHLLGYKVEYHYTSFTAPIGLTISW